MPSFKIIGFMVLEKIFEGSFLPCMGIAAHLGHVTWTIYINFGFLPKEAPHEIWLSSLIGQAVSEEMFEHCGRTTSTTDAGAWVYYKIAL